MAQVAELDALVASGAGIMVVGWVIPSDGKGVVAGDQALHITAHGLLGAEALQALGGTVTVQFVGVG
jgi:hypothetical protein